MGEGGLHLVEGAERGMEAARLGRGPPQGPAPIPTPHSCAPGCRAGHSWALRCVSQPRLVGGGRCRGQNGAGGGRPHWRGQAGVCPGAEAL